MTETWRYFAALTRTGSREEQLAEASAAGANPDLSPLARLVAKSVEVRVSFHGGQIRHTLVAAAELLTLIEQGCGFDDPDFKSAQVVVLMAQGITIGAAHDSAIVPLEAACELIDGFETFLCATGRPTLAADVYRACHAAILGNGEEATRLVTSCLPRVGHVNSARLGYGCPNCNLGVLIGALPLDADPDLVRAHLDPVFNGNEGYPTDSPAMVARIREWRGELECTAGLCSCHTGLARRLVHHGRHEEAEPHVRAALKHHKYTCFLLPEVAMVEWAVASGADEELAQQADALAVRTRAHEDIGEAVFGALRVAQAYDRLGRDEASVQEFRALTLEHADLLDERLPTPRWRALAEAELPA